jgi:hypothetical protein
MHSEQLELFETKQRPTARTCSDDKLLNSARIALRSGATAVQLFGIAERALSSGRIGAEDYDAAVEAVRKAEGSCA